MWVRRLRLTIPSILITVIIHGTFHRSVVSKSTSQLFIVNIFYCRRIVLTTFKGAYIKSAGLCVTGTTSFEGFVRGLFPTLSGTTWGKVGEAHETAPYLCNIFAFYVTHKDIVIRTNLSGFAVKMYSCLCEQYLQPLGLTASVLDFLFSWALVHCDNNPL